MTLRIYHQVGHFPSWNLSSFEEEQCGDGLILSPLHQSLSAVKELELKTRRRSLFDPQYYLPNSPKIRLGSYPFFPEQISNGFSTTEFPLVALESAKQCVAFQCEQHFEGIVIPTRFIDQMKSKYFEIQEEYTVLPFLKALSKQGTSKPVYLTVPITSAMLLDDEFRTKLLNWITSFPDVTGVYVLVNDERKTKQICSADVLFAYLEFAHALNETNLKVILGHLNTESVLLSMIEGVTLTFGSFENTRMFSLDKFIDNEEDRRAPKARIFLPGLLNWVQYGHATQIREEEEKLWDNIYNATPHSEAVLASPVEPYFSRPELYKHHFLCLQELLKPLAPLSSVKRYQEIRAWIKAAMAAHEQLVNAGIDLDRHGNGEHLQGWLDSANQYYRKYLKP